MKYDLHKAGSKNPDMVYISNYFGWDHRYAAACEGWKYLGKITSLEQCLANMYVHITRGTWWSNE